MGVNDQGEMLEAATNLVQQLDDQLAELKEKLLPVLDKAEIHTLAVIGSWAEGRDENVAHLDRLRAARELVREIGS